MFEGASISVIIPALDEEQAIAGVLRSLPPWVDDVIVVDNGSTDATASVAAGCGARVVLEPRRGYGTACLAGIAATRDPDIAVFLDGDGSDDPTQIDRLVAPIARGETDMVIGSRTLGTHQRGSITIQQRVGNAIACILVRALWGVRYTDLGPFRAIRAEALCRLDMDDPTYGWTMQMQIRAAKLRLRSLEVPVDYRRRIGHSKISGTLRGAIGAGVKIITTIFKERCRPKPGINVGAISNRLVVFTRYPEPGFAKTRLIPALGPVGAANLQRDMTLQQLQHADVLQRCHTVGVEVRFAGGDQPRMKSMFGGHRSYHAQGEGELGARLDRAIREAFACGGQAAVVVGTDCPALDSAVLGAAFDALRANDVVLGPATDGGYYLIGMRSAHLTLFREIEWGTEHVLAQTLTLIRRAGLTCHLLAPLSDVDRPEDIALWGRTVARNCDAVSPRLSVIVPTLNEQEPIASTLDSIGATENVELIVVDGGSRDRTVEFARRHGAIILQSAPGRARQMNAGAAIATGDVLLFLHADTRLPPGYLEIVKTILDAPSVVSGAFRLNIAAPSWSFRLIERLANVRSRRLRLPYGDQAIFVTKRAFHQVGGFPDIPILEDYVFMRRLRKLGRVAISTVPVVTSARRWVGRGIIRTTLVNQACLWAYRLGVSPERISQWRPPHSGVSNDTPQGDSSPIRVAASSTSP